MKVIHQILISYVHSDGGIWSESVKKKKLRKIMSLIKNVINVYDSDETKKTNRITKSSSMLSKVMYTIVTSHCFSSSTT